MKRIAIDMDDVIADFTSEILAKFNHKFGKSLTREDLQGKKLWAFLPHLNDEIMAFVDDPLFFRDLTVMDGSQEVIRELSQHYEIFIATAAMEHPSSFTAKFEWLKEHFPFLLNKNFVFCGDKSIIHADYLIDDSVRHFEGFSGQGILFTAHHNAHEQRFVRVNNWQEVREYFL